MLRINLANCFKLEQNKFKFLNTKTLHFICIVDVLSKDKNQSSRNFVCVTEL